VPFCFLFFFITAQKSNDNKRANQFDFPRVLFQIKYLGLLENLRVRRAGFAYRREWHDFVKRFALLSAKTWPNDFAGSDKDAAKAILTAVKKVAPELVARDQVQLGRTMIFVKDPETIAAMDALKMERLGGMFAKFQRLWRHYKKNKEAVAIKNATALFLFKAGKERRRESFYRPYSGLYLCDWRRDERLLSLLHHYEPDDRLRLVFMDRVALVTANAATPAAASLALTHPALFAQAQPLAAAHAHWKREEVIMAVSKEHIYIIQDNSAAAASAAASSASAPAALVPQYFLRRLLPLTFLESLSLTPFADTFLAVHVAPGAMAATQPAPAWVPDADASTCGECGEKFGLFFRRHHCRACTNHAHPARRRRCAKAGGVELQAFAVACHSLTRLSFHLVLCV
jgi:myosin-1